MANKLIFRKFIEAREHVELSKQNKEFFDEDVSLEKKQLSVLKEIFHYIKNDENWAGQEKSRKKAIIFIKNRCNYERTKEEIKAKSKNSIEASMSYLSKKLEKKIGATTIDLVLEGKVEEAMVQFRTGTGKLNPSEFIIDGLFDLLPYSDKPYAALEDCEKELKILLTFTKSHLSQLFTLYNKSNFSYLIYVLTSTDRAVADEREILYRLLNGEFNLDEDRGPLTLNVQIKEALKELLTKGFR